MSQQNTQSHQPARFARKQAGFNLLELMTVLFVAGILMTVGIPAFNGFVANNRMSTAANDLAITLHMARTEALKRRASVSVCPSTQWAEEDPACTAGGFEDGWIVFVDAIAPALPDMAHTGPNDVIFTHGPLPDGVDLDYADAQNALGGQPRLIFLPNGFPLQQFGGVNTVFNFQLCDDRGDANTGGGVAAGRWIQLTPTGRPQIYREQAQVQSGINPAGGC